MRYSELEGGGVTRRLPVCKSLWIRLSWGERGRGVAG
jgi:hypothetical protein